MLLHVISHNCSEMHRNVAIPDYRSLATQTSEWTFVTWDTLFASLTVSGGYESILMVQHILIIEIDLLYGWAVLERRPNHVKKRVVADI